MKIDFELNELIPTMEEISVIRQVHAEAEQNAASGGDVAAEWQEEADRIRELLAFLEAPQTDSHLVPPRLAAWVVRLAIRAGQLSDFDAHFAADALEADAPDAFPLLATSEQSGDYASALTSAAIYVQALLERQGGEDPYG